MKRNLLTALTALSMGIGFAQSPFFTKTCYRGAFAPAPNPMWTDNWTEWDPKNKQYPTVPTMTVTGNITANTTWSTGAVVLLSSQCYIKNNAVLTIQPGVIVLGNKATTGAGIFVTKGSQIIANGTASSPIVFTSNQAPGARGLGDWGGIILLGKAAGNMPNGIGNIEGLPVSSDTEFGGGTTPDDNDNSGSLQYVRIEFGGYVYAPDKEINGLTFGCVGRLTTIDHIQVSYSNDDAYEWFGGSVNCKHLVSYRCLDDDFDTDNGFSGKVQFGLAVRDPQIADNPSVSTSEIFESDNDATGTTNTPQTSAIFCNITGIGPLRGTPGYTASASGHRSRARIRRNSALKIYNTILMDQATRGLFIDGALAEGNAANGLLKFKSNIVAGYGQKATETTSGSSYSLTINTFISPACDTLISSANILANPYAAGTPTLFTATSADYRPAANSIALSGASFTDAALAAVTIVAATTVQATVPSTFCIGTGTTINQTAVFAPSTTITADYCSISWSVSAGVSVSSTTATAPSFSISTLGTFSVYLMVTDADGPHTVMNTVTTNTCLDVAVKSINNTIGFVSVYPNPTKDMAVLTINTPNAASLNAGVYDITGKLIMHIAQNQNILAGENKLTIDTQNLNNGIYFVTLSTANGKETVKLIVNK